MSESGGTVQSSTITINSAWTPDADGTRDFGTAALRWRDAFLSSSVRVGATPASTGGIRSANAVATGGHYLRNAANTADIHGISVDAANNLRLSGTVAGDAPAATYYWDDSQGAGGSQRRLTGVQLDGTGHGPINAWMTRSL